MTTFKNQTQQHIIQVINEYFNHNDFHPDNKPNGQNVWVMAIAIRPLQTIDLDAELQMRFEQSTPENQPTHIARLAVRVTDSSGTNPFADGTDIFIQIDEQKQTATLAWDDLWSDGCPIFHGGSAKGALEWTQESGILICQQCKDPFLTSEERFALNGHDEDFGPSDNQ
jgi:hypothetical protein